MDDAGGSAPRALVVDDERDLAALIGDYLARDGFEVSVAYDGNTAVNRARDWAPDLVILDLGLPGLNGIEVCRTLRTFSSCYILMVTARSEEVDTLIGLSAGADDYMTKPFSPRELAARAQVLMRRPRTEDSRIGVDATVLRVGALSLDTEAREVWIDGARVELTKIEFDLLATLASRPRQVFTRRTLIEAVWGTSWVGDEHLVDAHVLHVRQKLGDSAEVQTFVKTLRGVGYRMGDG